MADTTDKDVRTDAGAGAPGNEQTEEQIWAELAAEREGTPPDADDARTGDGAGDEDKGAAAADAADADKTGQDAADAAKPAGPDIWANATPDQRAAYEAANAIAKEFPAGWKEQIFRRTRENDRLKARIRELEAAPAASGSKGKDGAPAADAAGGDADEDLREFEETYPEVAAPVRKMLDAQRRQIELLQQQVGGIVTDKNDFELSQELDALNAMHPDWGTVAGSKEFQAWAQQQHPMVQQILIDNKEHIVSAYDAGYVVQLYKRDAGMAGSATATAPNPGASQKQPPNNRRQAQLRSAATPANRSAGPVSDMPDANDEEGAWDYFKRKRERAAASP
ncbi:MAG: hypothetical protein VW405_00685 [Rhodospirillaceae bacterium]